MQKNRTTDTVQTPAQNFTGDVYMDPLFDGDGTSQLVAGLVRFTPGARTNWHSHPNGQLLVCTDGVGLVGTRDGTTVLLRMGESAWTPAGEEHFHGGTATTMMCHYAIVDAAGPDGATIWLEPVTDEQYTAAAAAAGADDVTINATARQNRDALFALRTPDLAASDPELVEYFDNFAFDEVLADAASLDPNLDRRTIAMVRLAAIIAAGGLSEFRDLAAAAVANAGVTPVELKEIIYQSVAYAGMARASDYLRAANEILTSAGAELPLPGQSACAPETRFEYGKTVQGRIVGDDAVATRLRDACEDEVHFFRYLADNCFGDTVGRHGLDLGARELLTFSMLSALGGADAQLRGHVGANLTVGNDRTRLLAVLTVLVPYIGHPRTLNALAAINAVTR